MGEAKDRSPLKDGLEALKAFGPGEEAIAEIRQTAWGRWLAESTVVLGLVAGYFAAAWIVHHLVIERASLYPNGTPWYIFAAFAMPLFGVAIFRIFPDILKARRKSRLHEVLDNPEPPKPGYFRLHPYEAKDAARYSRPDNAVVEAIDWIKGTDETVLYLSGASGSGKSSLVAAGLTPALESEGWAVLSVRGMGAPLASLTGALRAAEHLYLEPPHHNTGAPTLLERAAAERLRAGNAPLLVILDQFEEYLILESGEDHAAYAELLRTLAETPILGVKLLHLFRSDYEELIFKQGLPDLLPRRNGFKLAAFTRREAQAFLESGPRVLDVSGYGPLFAGLDRIEETRGLYRPITLNMIGFVLEREGTALADDPGKLIERYLADCIERGDARDSVQDVLKSLITKTGTKEPRAEVAIAEEAGLTSWQARATLTTLQDDGLVRPLDGKTWDVSHDFLARVLNGMLMNVKAPWYELINTRVLSLSGLGWLLVVGLSVSHLARDQIDAAKEEIGRLGFNIDGSVIDGVGFLLRHDVHRFNDDDLKRFASLSSNIPVTSLDLTDAYNITDLSPLKGMKIRKLILWNVQAVNDLKPLRNMPLIKLDLTNLKNIRDLTPLSGSPIEEISIANAIEVRDLSPIATNQLREINISGANNIITLSSLGKDVLIIGPPENIRMTHPSFRKEYRYTDRDPSNPDEEFIF